MGKKSSAEGKLLGTGKTRIVLYKIVQLVQTDWENRAQTPKTSCLLLLQ